MSRPPETRIGIPCGVFIAAVIAGLCALGALLT